MTLQIRRGSARGILLVGLLALGAHAAPAPQSGKALLTESNESVFLVDFDGASAEKLSIPAALGDILQLSPGAAHVLVAGPSGVSVYALSGGAAGLLSRVTADPVLSAVWSQDGKSIGFFRRNWNEDGSSMAEIYVWELATKKLKRAL